MTVKELRAMTGLSQSKFAARFGIPVRTLQEWEQGRQVPPSYVVAMMTEFLQKETTMKFQDENHEQRYLQVLSRMQSHDGYHRSAAYLIALANLVPTDVFDFEEDCIRHEGLFAGWQTHSTRKTTRLMFSLWNGCYEDHAADEPKGTSTYYTVDEIFSNYEYAPYFYEAVRIRFEWI